MEKKNIILFGASKLGEIAYEYLKEFYNIVYFCDNNSNKWGKTFCNIEIISPNKLNLDNIHKIIVTSMYYNEIKTQLIKNKVDENKIYKFNYDFDNNKLIFEDLYIRNIYKKYIIELEKNASNNEYLAELNQLVERLIKVDCESYYHLLIKSIIEYNYGNYYTAIKLLEKCLFLEKNDARTMYYLYESYKSVNDLTKQNEVLQRISNTLDTKRYIIPNLNIRDIFYFLNLNNINYVVVQYSQILYGIPIEKKVEILMSDEDIDKINKWFLPIEINGSTECYIYSVSGLLGSDFYCEPVLPIELSKRILENKLLHRDGYYVIKDDELYLRNTISMLSTRFSVNMNQSHYSIKKERIIKEVSSKERTTVFLVEYDNELAIKKVFNEGYDRMFKRELFAYKELSKYNSNIPKLIAYSHNVIIIPYYEDKKKNSNEGMYLIKYRDDIKNFLDFIHINNYKHLDFHHNNIIFTNEGIKIIDFEFLSFNRKYNISKLEDMINIDDNYNEDIPVMKVNKSEYKDIFNSLWYENIGCSFSQFLNTSLKNIEKQFADFCIENINNLILNKEVQLYQPLLCKDEYNNNLIQYKYKRDCKYRWSLIEENLIGCESYLDIGSQNGYYVFKVAEKNMKSIGVEIDINSIKLCKNLIPLNNNVDDIKFINLGINEFNINDLPNSDIISCMAVFHWWVVQYGKDSAFKIMKVLFEKCNKKLIFETGQYDEGAEWSNHLEFMGYNTKEWVEKFLLSLGFKTVKCIGIDTIDHVESYQVAKQRYIFLGEK